MLFVDRMGVVGPVLSVCRVLVCFVDAFHSVYLIFISFSFHSHFCLLNPVNLLANFQKTKHILSIFVV